MSRSTFDFFVDDVHSEEMYPRRKRAHQAFSFQLSDHFPLWLQLGTNIHGRRLDQIVQAVGNGTGDDDRRWGLLLTGDDLARLRRAAPLSNKALHRSMPPQGHRV
jgi:hypothetical protein